MFLIQEFEVIGDFDYEIKGNQGIPMAYTSMILE